MLIVHRQLVLGLRYKLAKNGPEENEKQKANLENHSAYHTKQNTSHTRILSSFQLHRSFYHLLVPSRLFTNTAFHSFSPTLSFRQRCQVPFFFFFLGTPLLTAPLLLSTLYLLASSLTLLWPLGLLFLGRDRLFLKWDPCASLLVPPSVFVCLLHRQGSLCMSDDERE